MNASPSRSADHHVERGLRLVTAGGEGSASQGHVCAVPEALAEHDAFVELFRRSRAAMLLVDDEQRYVGVNAAACRLYGVPSEEILGRTIFHLTPEALRERVPASWALLLSEGTLEGPFEVTRPGGARIQVTYSATANIVPGIHLSIIAPVEGRGEPAAVSSTEASDGKLVSRRELEVLRLVALGLSNQEVGSRLGIASDTVRNHIRAAREKLGARTKAHAVALALQQNLLER